MAIVDKRLFQTSAAMRTANTTVSSDMRQTLQYKIDSEFTLASDYYLAQKLNRDTLIWEDLGLRISKPYNLKEATTIRDDYREFSFANLDVSNLMGDLYKFNSHIYMTIDTAKPESPTNSCLVQRVNIELKFTEATPITSDIISIYGIATSRVFDPTSREHIDLPNANMKILIPNNSNALKIRTNSPTRFLIGLKVNGQYQTWKVAGMNTVNYVRPTFGDTTPVTTNGIIELLLQRDTAHPKDNHTVGVAWQNYFT